MKFSKLTEFIDYEGMPITNHLNSERELEDEFIKGLCYCWDRMPPRTFDLSSALRNGAPCDESLFRILTQKNILNREHKDSKELLLIEHWFNETANRNKTFDWLSNLTQHEIILFALSLNTQILNYREQLKKEELSSYEAQTFSIFKNSLQNALSKNKSFLFFIEELEAKLLVSQNRTMKNSIAK